MIELELSAAERDARELKPGQLERAVTAIRDDGFVVLHQAIESDHVAALREKMLDEDVAAGIRLWHTKQSVFHFDKEAMEQLEATVKDLQAKSFDVAVSLQPALAYPLLANALCPQLHFTDFGSCSLVLHSKGIRASAVGQLGG